MSVSLPRYITLSIPGSPIGTPRFLEMVHEDVASHGLFIAKGVMILSPSSKLELVDAGGGRVHIRCSYNNKYLAIRSETDHRISAVADEPVEDQSSWSCTMFKVNRTSSSHGGGITVEHAHFQSSKVVAREPDRILMVDRIHGADFVFSLHDVSALLALKLPQFVTFKADNGNYGQIFTPTDPSITFSTKDWNENMVHEILPVDVGFLLVRNFSNNRCWIYIPRMYNRVGAHASVDHANLPAAVLLQDCFFNIQRIGNDDDNIVAISRSQNGAYLIRKHFNYLIPTDPTYINTPEARFVMEEAVKSRAIYNVRYNVGAARVLFGHPKSIESQTMYNGSLATQNFERTFTYNETTNTNWNATVSASYSMSATVTAKVPFVSEGSLTVGWEISISYDWGSEHTISVTKEDKLIITALPMAVTVASRWESQSKYDVPFSYTQEDTLFDGRKIVTQKHDGLAIGINNSDIFYRISQTPLDRTRSDEAREYIIVPESSRIVSTTNDLSLTPPPPAAAPE